MLCFFDITLTTEEMRQANDGLAAVLRQKPVLPEKLFPPLVYLQKQAVCDRTVHELLPMIEDEFTHCLSALHNYALYRWLDACQAKEQEQLPQTADSAEAKEADFFSLDELNLVNPAFYLERSFLNYRFLHVAMAFEHYKNDHAQYLQMRMNLAEYVDLMPDDIRQEYLRLQAEQNEDL